jgi:hypothetical protein
MEKTVYILDSNYRHEPTLEEWLSKPTNYVALSDFAAVEMFKGREPLSIVWATELLRKQPHKIIILKNTPSILRMPALERGLRRRLIDHPGTKNFPNFLRDITNTDDEKIIEQLLERQAWANEHQDRVRLGMEKYPDAVREIASAYSKEERSHMRGSNPYPNNLGRKILDAVCQLTEDVYKRIHPAATQFNGPIYNTYHFRYSLCTFLLILRIVADGGNASTNISKIVNDDYDMTYCAFATYFDGLLTKDRKAMSIYLEARSVINGIKRAVDIQSRY